jgi:hypothetical protein
MEVVCGEKLAARRTSTPYILARKTATTGQIVYKRGSCSHDCTRGSPTMGILTAIEVEKGELPDVEKDASVVATDAPNSPAEPTHTILVSWDGPSDPKNPYNWSQSRKWATTILTSLGGLVTLMSGPMLAPALDVIGADLHISQAEASMALSIYILAFAFGPMVLAPCSEVWGRKMVWVVGGSWYVLWNTLCGLSRSRGLLITGRMMAGLGASAEFAVSIKCGNPILRRCAV